MFLALMVLTSFGTADFRVAEEDSSIVYSQSEASLTLTGGPAFGGTLGGEFLTGPQDWGDGENLGLRMSVEGTNPNLLFFVDFLGGEDFEVIATYVGSTEVVGATPQDVVLTLEAVGPGGWNDVRGLQFTWDGAAPSIPVTLESVVRLAGLTPVITSTEYVGGVFRMTWTGTGSTPVRVERRESLVEGVWHIVAEGITSGSFADPVTPARQGFYQVVVP
jgi:hypothetical protein